MRGLIVDSFAGGGGASLGIEWALGRSPDIAINHDEEAIAVHRANHPTTDHLSENIGKVDPVKACAGRRVALLWASPDCKHHSKAKGGKPVDKKIRGLAWVVIAWAKRVRPDVIILENVEEFADWGPLLDDEKTPDPTRKGLTFRQWLGRLKACGYEVEMREMRACDYGAPTSRRRLFVIARSDGRPIIWPSPTHGPHLARKHRTAAECIDFGLPMLSIFATKDEARAFARDHGTGTPRRPLEEATLKRIARGIRRFVLDTARPFLIPVTHQGDARVHSIDGQVPTITAAHRGELAFVAPTPVQTGYGEREGQAPRSLDLHRPLGVVVGCGVKHALVSAFLAKHYGGHEGSGTSLHAPASTVTTQDHHALVASHLVKLRGTCADGQRLDMCAPTICAGANHVGEVRAFLTRYNGVGDGQRLDAPAGTATARDRFALVTVDGHDYAIADIGMRMLTPRELARAQGFPDGYVLDPVVDGKRLAKDAQVRMVGNSVCPPIAAALVRANVTDLDQAEAA